MTLQEFLDQFAERFSEWEYEVKQDMLNSEFSPEDFTFSDWMDDLRNTI